MLEVSLVKTVKGGKAKKDGVYKERTSALDSRAWSVPLTDEQRRVVEENMPLVVLWARRCRQSNSLLARVPIEDVRQYAVIGMCLAVRTWDRSRGALSTHAVTIIRHVLARVVSEVYGCIRLPSCVTDWRLSRENSRVAERNRAKVTAALLCHGSGGEAQVVLDSCPDESFQEQDFSLLTAYLEKVEPRWREVLKRTVMNGETCLSVARDLGVTKERVRQMRNSGLRKIRKMIERDGLSFDDF